MLNSVKLGSDAFLWKRSIPFKEKIFTICIDGSAVLHLYLALFGAMSSFERVAFFLALMVSAKLSIKSFPKKC